MVLAPVVGDRLLQGEDPATVKPQDARHWITVYREMIAFKTDLLDRVKRDISRVSPPAKTDLTDDIGLVEAQLGRYQRRLGYWFDRQWELEGMQIDSEARTISRDGHLVSLTRREFQILTVLLSRPDKYFTAEQLLIEAWHDGRLPEESLRTYITRVRKKLKELRAGAHVVNKYRRGYALVFSPPG